MFAPIQTDCCEFISTTSCSDVEFLRGSSSSSWTSGASAQRFHRHASTQHVSNESTAAAVLHQGFSRHFLLTSNGPEGARGERAERCLRMPIASVGTRSWRTHSDDITPGLQTPLHGIASLIHTVLISPSFIHPSIYLPGEA